MGGSFDPPHTGHLVLAQEAQWQLGLDRVLLVPVGVPPHKPEGSTLSAERRFALVQAAVVGSRVLEASRIEVDRPGPSYTADTLEQVAQANPGADLWFILGGDQLAGLGTWYRPERIVELARLALAMRPGTDPRPATDVADALAPGRVDRVVMPEIAVSSTMIRARLARGEPIRYLVPDGVADLLEPNPAS